MNNEHPMISNVEETEDFTHHIINNWDSYNYCPTEDLERVPIIQKSKLEGKFPIEILNYLQIIDVLFVEG